MHFSHLRIYLLYVLLNICSFRDPEGVIAKIKTTAMTENVSNNSTTKCILSRKCMEAKHSLSQACLEDSIPYNTSVIFFQVSGKGCLNPEVNPLIYGWFRLIPPWNIISQCWGKTMCAVHTGKKLKIVLGVVVLLESEQRLVLFLILLDRSTKDSFNGSKDEKFRLSVSKVKLSSASIDKMNLHLDNFVLQQKGAHFNKSNFLLRKKRYLQDTLDKSLSHLLNISRLKTYPQYIDDDSSLAYKKRKSYFNKDSTFQDYLGLGNNYFKTIPNNSPHIIQTLPQNKKQTGESSHKAKRHLINWKKKIHDSNRSKRWFDNKILKLEGDLQRSLWHLINGSHVGKRAPRDNFLEELYANLNSQSRIMKNGYGAPSHMLVLKSKVPTPPRLSSFKRKSTVPSLTLYPPGYPKSIIIPPSSPPKIVPPPPVAAVPRLQFTNPWQDRVTKNISRSVLSLKVTEHNILSAEKILLTALFNLKKTLTRTLERTSYWNQRWMLHKLEQTVYNATRFAAWSMVQKTCERSLRLAQEAGYIYWSEWTTWSGCSGDCNSPGFRVRHRTCKSGRICIGPSFDIVVCAMKIKCQAKWLEWAPWNRCSATCGSGIQTRSRICLTEDEDTPCNGDSVVSRSCPGIPCKQVTPVKGLKKVFAASLGRPVSKGQEHWSSWGLWSSCSVSCGEGNQTRARACVRRTTNDLIKLPVDDIFCPGTARQRKWCNLPCNVLKVITCDDNPCKNDALCEEVMDSKSGLGFHFRCLCKSGFHGRNCETAVISPSHMMWIKTLAYFLLGLIIALIVICIAMFVYFRIQSNKKTSMTFTPIPRHRSEDLWQMHENEGKSSSNLSGLTESDSGSSGRTSSKKGFKNVSADESFNSLQNSKITIRSTHFTEPDDPAMVLSSDDDYQSCEESSSVEKDLKNYSKNDTGNASPRVGNTSRHKQPRGNKISQIRVTQPPEPSVSSDLVYNDEVMEMRIHSNLNRLEEVQDRINSPDSSENGEYQLCAIVTRSERNDDNFSHYQESGDSSGEVDFTNSDYRTVNGNRSTQRKINKENEIETFSRHRGKPSDETQSNNKKPSIETQSNRNKSSDKTQSRSSKLSNETQSNSNKPSNETHSNSNKPSTSGREQRTFSCDGQESKSGHNNPGSSWNSNTSVNPLGAHLDWSFEDRASASTSRDENKTGSDCRASASTSRDENKTGSDCRREYSPQGAHICASSNSHFLSYSDQTNEAGCANRTRHEKCVAFNEVGSTSRDRHENFVVFNEGGNLIKARCENGVAFNEGASANRIRHSIGIAFNEGGKVNRARYESGVALQESSISFNSCHASTNQHYDSYPPIVDQMDERLLHNARGQNGDFIPTTASNQQQYLDGGGEGSTTSARRDQRKSDREVLLRRAIENSFVQSTSGTSLCNIQRSEQQILPKTPAVNQTQSSPSNRINDYSIDEDTRPLDVNWLENQDPQTLSVLHVISTPKKAKSRSQTLDRRKTPSSSFDRGTPSTSSDSKSSSTNSESSDSDSSESQTQKTRLSHSRSEDDSSRHISNPYMSSAHTSSPKIQEHGSSSFQREFVNSERSDRNSWDKDRGFDKPMKENDLKAKHRLMPNTSSGSQARASHSLSLRDNQEPSLTAKLNLDKSSYWDSYNQSSIFGQSTSASSSSREEHAPCHEHLISQNQMFQAMQPTNILLSDSNYSSDETTQISHHPAVPLKSALRSSHSKGQSKNHIQSVVRRRVSFSEPEVSGVQYKTESAHGSFRQQDLKSGKSTNELNYLPGRPSSPEDQFEEFSQSQGSSTNIFFRESIQKHSSPFSYEGAHSLDSIHVHFQSQEEKQSADFDQKKRSSSDLEVCSIESCFLQSEENQSCRDRVMQAQIHEFALQESSANDGVPSPTFYPVTKTCETLPTGKKNSTQPGEQSSSAPASTEPLNSPVIKSKASDNRTLYMQPPTLVHRKESGSSDRLSRAVEDAAALKMIYDKDGVLADMKESENPSQAPSPAFEQSTPDEPCTSLHHAALSFDSFQHLLIQRKPGAFFKPINKLKPSGSSTS